MAQTSNFEIFLVAAPGLEALVAAEARETGFQAVTVRPGAAIFRGGWPHVWRANLKLRGTSKIIAQMGAFRAEHLSQLDKRTRKFPWSDFLRADVPFRVEATARASKIYHSGAAAERVARAIAEELGAPQHADADVCVRVRIENDTVAIGVDTSGELLHKRGFKAAVNKAPMRETMAAMFLRQCGYSGKEPVLDPMCGSGTFIIEAAEIAAGLDAGRERTFAFEQLATFDAEAWNLLRAKSVRRETSLRFFGRDRDAGAVRMSCENAERAGVTELVDFATGDIAGLAPIEGPPGIVIINPPYGDRIGSKKPLQGLYRSLGKVLTHRFAGWRVGLITTDGELAAATGLPFKPAGAPVAHGGLRVTLHQTAALA